MRTKLFLAAALAVAATAPGFAQTQQGQLSDTDRMFIENAASSNLFEIRSSQMMLENMGDAQDMPTVRQFAQQMITEHETVGAQLEQLAGSLGMQEVPQEPAATHRTMLEELQGFSGEQLAPNYLQYQTVAHQDAVNLFQRHTQQGDNEQLKQFAQQTLPSLQQHLDMVRDIQAGAGVAESDPARQPSTSQ
jgi:putative membrane protein